VEATQSQPDSVTTAPPQTAKESATRLVIRITLPKDAPRVVPESQRPNRFALKRILAAIALLIVVGVAIGVFKGRSGAAPESERADNSAAAAASDTASPAGNVAPHSVESTTDTSGSASAADRGAASPTSTPVVAEAPPRPDTPPTPINEVVPDVPQSALDTIRGTVRVAVRVVISQEGSVLTATSHNPGPSRYFERLSLEAARQWTFTPSRTPEPREMLLHFHYTREGPTAKAEGIGNRE